MSVHLLGGGWQEQSAAAVYGGFVDEASARAEAVAYAGPARVAVVVVRDGDGLDHAGRLESQLAHGGEIDARVTVLVEGYPLDPAVFDDVDGIVVGGGLTPAYRQSLEPAFERIRDAVAGGVPYLGYSAGAMISAERAIIGGSRIGDVPVAPEEAAEELDEVTVVPGIGLVDLTVDVHAAQWGTVSRVIAATAAGLTDGGVAIDEGTALVVGADGARVVGAGNVWRVAPGEAAVAVSILSATD